MARAKSNGSYAPLGATYYRDDAILEAGEAAELLFVRCLAFCADASSDGFITERQILLVVGMGLADMPERVAMLVEVGVLEKVDGGYVVRSWLKWNRSSAEIGRHLKRDRQRKAAVRALETVSARNPDGIPTDSKSASEDVRLPITTQHYKKDLSIADAPDVFDSFWELYPKKEAKGAAVKAFKAAVKKVGAETVIDGLKAQLPILAKTERQFIPLAGTWLNAERWADEITDADYDPTDQWARAYRMNGPKP